MVDRDWFQPTDIALYQAALLDFKSTNETANYAVVIETENEY